MNGLPFPSRQPTGDECTEDAYVEEFDAYATWWPQMGGYSAVAWIQFDDNGAEEGAMSNTAMLPGGCFEVIIYHDYEFSIHEDRNPEQSPIVFHACNAEQFVNFGNAVQQMELARRELKHGKRAKEMAERGWEIR